MEGTLDPGSFEVSRSFHFGKIPGSDYKFLESEGICIDEAKFLEAGAIGLPQKPAPVEQVDSEMIPIPASNETLSDLGSALRHLAANGQADRHREYSSVGLALKAESRNGRELELKALFLEFAKGSHRFAGEYEVLRDWDRFNGTRTGIAGGVFAKAQGVGMGEPGNWPRGAT